MAVSLLLVALVAQTVALSEVCSVGTIRIEGVGEVEAVPDLATLTVKATGRAISASQALDILNQKIEQLLGVLDGLGVPQGNYSTTHIDIAPELNYETRPTTVVGNLATQTLSIRLTSGLTLGQTIEAMSAADAEIGGLRYDLLDREVALEKARILAMTDAETKYGDYLGLTGKARNGIRKIEEVEGERTIPYASDAARYRLDSLLQVFEGKVKLSARVGVTFGIQ